MNPSGRVTTGSQAKLLMSIDPKKQGIKPNHKFSKSESLVSKAITNPTPSVSVTMVQPISKHRHSSSVSGVGLTPSPLTYDNPSNILIPKFDKTKTIIRQLGPVAGFCVNTNRGNTRNYNEDRVSVLLNAQQK